MTSETLSGIPSIVYGLFGYLFFLVQLRMTYSLLAGACTLAIMILPLIMRTTEEALLAVDPMYREGSFGLGAGRLRTVFRIVLPSAVPGILSGITMEFVPAVSTFVITKLLGGSKVMMIGDKIENMFIGQYQNYNVGASLSLVLMVLILLCMALMSMVDKGDDEMGGMYA